MPENIIAAARPFSLYLCRHLDNGNLKPEILYPLLERAFTPDDFAAFTDWQALIDDENEAELARQLRVLRRYVMAHIISRDLARVSHLAEVTATITRFADFAINTALTFSYRYYMGLYGEPLGRYSGQVQHLSVVAMGKMGGYELNVSSDIDLIFVFPESGDTNGKREKSNQEFFTKVGQKLIALLNDSTGDGQVFRVDMRLRPDGDSGALVLSETALEQYLITQGREWERYAWIKGRVLTPYPNDITALVRPFVYRKYLDFNAYEAMRSLHRQIRQEVTRKGMAENVKLGAGGIREVEFIAQIFQLIRGGQVRSLQLKGTQETLHELAKLGMLEAETVATLLSAYRFLRDVEHRLQYWDDQQTQTLPQSAEQCQKLAESMGFADYDAFSGSLNVHRRAVNRIFNDILADPDDKSGNIAQEWEILWHNGDDEPKAALLQRHGFQATPVLQALHHLRHSNKYRQLSPAAQQRFDKLVPQIVCAAASTDKPNMTLSRLLNFLEAVSRRSAYLAFLHEHPQALAQVAQLMSQSSWVATYLQRHPILLDELLSDQVTEIHIDWAAMRRELAQQLDDCGNDVEAQMDVLRRFQHAKTFQLAVQDLAGLWTIEALSDQLSALADVILQQSVQRVWQALPKKHCSEPRFAVIGYGKLGGKELGYASDLDLVYLYDDDHPDAANFYSRLAQRITSWLTAATGAGALYEVDLRLRPDGEAGFSAASIQMFDLYQREKAWTWEHQALTRARFVAGDENVGKQFDAVRCGILTHERNIDELKREIIDMREKMFPTHPPRDSDVKYARGGVVDVEFIVQYLILAHAHHYPQLLQNYGNIALLSMAADVGLIDETLAETARTAYRHYRKQQHNTKLRDALHAEVDDTLLFYYGVVKQLWLQVFGEEAKISIG
ncbi:bifunctional [glutamate--ammonia ligase]-adenylyl-L-tyrosine phosphorylase/[glutamate--ammonia-ligase] adenylyltransferase [Stenoxybacter acetivorans]|uniref:bifunctional [glutamate--ammonia ligase]-adenylyl-L-tyrosine phosphorylase/[glutamate--ammonia-ligase] adenylyltransferase n=1 Tax=Stenoxybacter acetivorans TaxID=422441 RepID=UPI0012EB5401|nr:bifunctional [glutamate--ammonia ligase]-adenylyl-L-tyrosine phosphorylase/[glutamate--ammonia-ligase] adenylyltransferase [Stenoxybacter acetivorans]